MERQPLLHDRLVCLVAPTQAWSGADGQIRQGAGIDGVYDSDLRVLSAAVVTIDGTEPETISTAAAGTGTVRVSSLVRQLDDPASNDPTVRLDRLRTVEPGRFTECFELTYGSGPPAPATLTVTVAADLRPMDEVKAGHGGGGGLPAEALREGGLRWQLDQTTVALTAPGASIDLSDPTNPRLTWRLTGAIGRDEPVAYHLTVDDAQAPMGPASAIPWSIPSVTSTDRRLSDLLDQSMADLAGLAMSPALHPEDVFVAAGAPWFFTLFGRDSLWTARMLLPLGTTLAASTLRTLARRQGRRNDPQTAEQPGKILHEVRRAAIDLDDGTRLPPVYYGTIDATPLWVCLLHDAWRWGLPADEIEALLPHAERALEWMAEHGDPDGDGFLEYIDASGHGLANQGWKDSGDAIRWRDGTLAEGTIALCEVQGYAHEAALGGAALLEAFGRPAAGRWREWAARLRGRFRERFWVADAIGRYPAIALDGAKRPVDSLTSNIGHLLGTGLLAPEEEQLVADRLVSERMLSGFGVHTLAAGSGGFWPLRYHGGTVWPHDTAIIATGLARAGFPRHAQQLAEQLLAAAPAFGFRLPELYSGDRSEQTDRPAPYPAACRPQAWTAAAAVALLNVSLGLAPDVPAGLVRVAPQTAPITVSGLRLAGQPLSVTVDPTGSVTVETTAPVQTRLGASAEPSTIR